MRSLVAVAALGFAACGGGSALPDARHTDAAVDDAPPDAGFDAAAVDAAPDARFDAAPDGALADASPTDGPPADAPPADAAGADAAPPDAALPDAGPDADLSCTIPAMTLGVSTVAGCHVPAAVDGTRDVARFHNPVNVAVGPDGTIYVADFDNDRIRRVTPAGDVTTLVHDPAFHRPFGLAFGPSGTLYAQTDDNSLGQHSASTGTIWRIDLATGAPTLLVENVGRPRGLAVLASGQLVLSDYVHHVIRLLDPTTLVVAPLAGALDQPGFADGNGPDARFDGPYGVAVLADGSIAVAELGGRRIRRVTLVGNVTTLAGTGAAGADDGPAAAATFGSPQDLAVAADDTLYIADPANFTIRRLAAGVVDTVVGAGVPGYLDADDLRAAQIFGLEGIDLSSVDGLLYIADGSRGEDLNPHHRVRSARVAPVD